MKGRKPKPNIVKLNTGNPGKRPLNDSEPEPDIPDKCPSAPDNLCDIGKREWDRIAPLLHDMGLLSSIDLTALSAYCASYARWVDAEKRIRDDGMIISAPSGYPVQSPYLAIANKALDRMKAFLVEFGMTPSSRSRITVGNPKKKTNEWDEV